MLSLELYKQLQTSFIDCVIPDLKENSINLNKFALLDDLLTVLEASFKVEFNTAFFYRASNSKNDSQQNSQYLPSTNVMHILFTLASRSDKCNWTVTQSYTKNGISESLSQVKQSNAYYRKLSYKLSLSCRSLALLKQYVAKAIENPIDNTQLYQLLMDVISDLVMKPSFKSQFPHKKISDFYKTAKRNYQDDNDTGEDGKNILKKRRKSYTNRSKEEIETDDLVLSDSQEDSDTEIRIARCTLDGNKPIQGKQILTDMGRKSHQQEHEEHEEHGEQMEQLNHDAQVGNLPTIEKVTTRPLEAWNGLRVYDEPLLKDKLIIDNGFNIWKLINWTFYCAGLSSNYYYGVESNCSSIYKAEARLLDTIFDFLEANLVMELKRLMHLEDPYLQLSKLTTGEKKMMISHVENSSNILFLKLIKTLGHFRSLYYDRIVEYVFNGLAARLTGMPDACYQHEAALVKKEARAKNTQQSKNSSDYRRCKVNDNLDSMNLRFKMSLVTHHWSLIFTETIVIEKKDKFNINQRHSPLELNNFLGYLSEKLSTLDFKYLEAFYFASYYESKITKNYKDFFLMQLSCKFLLDALSSSNNDYNLKHRSFCNDNASLIEDENLNTILDWIQDTATYSLVTENELWRSFGEFYQMWLKVNFVLEWLILWVIQDFKQQTSHQIFLKRLNTLEEAFTVSDHLRQKEFFKFVKLCTKSKERKSSNSKTKLRFDINEADASFYKANFSKCDTFTSILKRFV